MKSAAVTTAVLLALSTTSASSQQLQSRPVPLVNAVAGSLNGTITPLFIVSVGESVADGEDENTRRRVYEFSPPGWDRKDTFG